MLSWCKLQQFEIRKKSYSFLGCAQPNYVFSCECICISRWWYAWELKTKIKVNGRIFQKNEISEIEQREPKKQRQMKSKWKAKLTENKYSSTQWRLLLKKKLYKSSERGTKMKIVHIGIWKSTIIWSCTCECQWEKFSMSKHKKRNTKK